MTGGAQSPAAIEKVTEQFLTPLTGAVKRKKFATWDLESKDGPTENAGFTRVFMAGFYDGADYTPFFDQSSWKEEKLSWKLRPFLPGGCIARLMEHALTDKYRGYSFYAHNAGSFDFLHILPWLVRNKIERGLELSLVPLGASSLLAIDVWRTRNKWQKWRFIDSVRLLPMSLDQAGKSFARGRKNEIQGQQILGADGKPFTIHYPEKDPGWIPYNRQDCVLLYDVLERVHDLVELDFHGEVGLTAPSTAIKTFRRAHLAKPIARDVHTHEFVRRGYFGGRTEVFAEDGHFLIDVDVNSSYPKQMTLDMPAGGAVTWTGEPPNHWKATRIGFCEVVVDVPADIAIPPLPVRAEARHFPDGSGVDGKLVFPTGRLEGVWEWGELDNALQHGCRVVEWKTSIWYDAEPILKDFVETLYRYRDQAHCFTCRGALGKDWWCETCQAAGYDAGLDAFAKLIANSTYGKFAQNTKRFKFYWITDPDMPEGCNPIIEDDPDCQVWTKEEEGDAPFIMPQISARITAQARVLLYQFAVEAKRRVRRHCLSCHSTVTFSGKKTLAGWKLHRMDHGGSGLHGDPSETDRIKHDSLSCPCGGALETRHGEVYYMDTDSLMTDVQMPTGAELGKLKDEIPRYSGYLSGRFYGPKLYRLGVEPEYLKLERIVRMRMLERDAKFLSDLDGEIEEREKKTEKALETTSWTRIKAKGISKKNRTKENLELLHAGALERLAWCADEANRHPDGSLKEMPEAIAKAGTLMEERLEKLGTLARLVRKDKNGKPILKLNDYGEVHQVSAAFERGPLMRQVPKRLHLEGAKRIHLGDGRTRPYHLDMTRVGADEAQAAQ